MSQQTKHFVLLDAHAILHRAYHALPDFSSARGEPTGALYGLSLMLMKIIAELRPDYIAACYDLPEPTYRHEAFKEYKAGRQKADSELVFQLEKSKELFGAFGIPIYSKPGFEADDILGTITQRLKSNENIVITIASGDMDTLQLVSGDQVKVYTLKKGIKDTVIYDEDAVKKRFGFGPELIPDYKGLCGDPSDNIPGVKGIGEKTASVLITKFGGVESIYAALAKDSSVFGGVVKPRAVELLKNHEEEAMFSKMLATIRRDVPISFQIPDKSWFESLDLEKVKTFFASLEFRTLIDRVKNLTLVCSGGRAETQARKSRDFGDVDEREFKEVAVALWLLDSNKTDPSPEEVLEFAREDSLAAAAKVIFVKLARTPMQKVFDEIEKPLIPILAAATARGIAIDAPYLEKLGGEYQEKLTEIQNKIWKVVGQEFNIASPKQLGEILFYKLGLKAKNQKKTGTGALSTKESELEKLRDSHPVISLVLEYRELAKLLGTYIETIPKMVDHAGRLHPKLLQAGTTTGRMASEDPNIQNIPKKSELGRKIRRGFVASPGFKLVAFDYSQIELRIAAFLSGDERLLELFKSGKDVHTAVASKVFEVSLESVTPEMRRQAKVINFGVMYGMGVRALKTNLGTSLEEAQKFYDDYFSTFSGLASYLDKTKASARRLGYTETLFGRRRYFSGLDSKLPFIRAAAERMAINAPIQGTEADIIKLATVGVQSFFMKHDYSEKAFLLFQVHDELVYEIKSDQVSAIVSEIKKIMQEVAPLEKTRGVVCEVEVSVGDNWEEMKKLK